MVNKIGTIKNILNIIGNENVYFEICGLFWMNMKYNDDEWWVKFNRIIIPLFYRYTYIIRVCIILKLMVLNNFWNTLIFKFKLLKYNNSQLHHVFYKFFKISRFNLIKYYTYNIYKKVRNMLLKNTKIKSENIL